MRKERKRIWSSEHQQAWTVDASLCSCCFWYLMRMYALMYVCMGAFEVNECDEDMSYGWSGGTGVERRQMYYSKKYGIRSQGGYFCGCCGYVTREGLGELSTLRRWLGVWDKSRGVRICLMFDDYNFLLQWATSTSDLKKCYFVNCFLFVCPVQYHIFLSQLCISIC